MILGRLLHLHNLMMSTVGDLPSAICHVLVYALCYVAKGRSNERGGGVLESLKSYRNGPKDTLNRQTQYKL